MVNLYCRTESELETRKRKGLVMKNVRVKVGLSCNGTDYHIGIFEGRKRLMYGDNQWRIEVAAIRNAKKMAKRIGIKYDPEIIHQHGC